MSIQTAIYATSLIAGTLGMLSAGAPERGGPVFTAPPGATIAAVPSNVVIDADLVYRPTPDRRTDAVVVELAPVDGSFTVLEARRVAEQGFLAAINEKSFGDALRIVVVRVFLARGSDDPRLRRTFVYTKRDASRWSLTAG